MAAKKTPAAKKATKKTTKRVAKAASTKIALKDDTLYVVLQRNKLLGWEVAAVYQTPDEAKRVAAAMEERSLLSFRAAKVERVKLAHA